MKNWRRWAVNCLIGFMGAAILLGGGEKKEDSSGTALLQGNMGLFQTADNGNEAEAENVQEEEKLLGGANLTLLANQSNSQMLSAVIQTKNGGLIVVDGGTPHDTDHLVETLKAKGGHVNAWLITHPHIDHVGALNTILAREEQGITIENVYYSLGPLSFYKKTSSASDVAVVENFMKNLEDKLPAEALHGDIKKDTQIQVDDVVITVLNEHFEFDTDAINNSSVCYMINVNGVYIDFLGDLGREGGEKLIKTWDTDLLKCDIIQMAHHGQGGVTEEVYKIFRPKICLWPTPQWLWDNDGGSGPGSGNFATETTKRWMNNLGVKKHYIMKDGDQVIE